MSGLPLVGDYDDRKKRGRQQLLALCRLRRDLERCSSSCWTGRSQLVAITDAQLAHALHELIAALDRRAPRIEQAGEASTSRAAAALRATALERLGGLAGRDASEADVADDPATRSVDTDSG
jgi:hypothetical protein